MELDYPLKNEFSFSKLWTFYQCPWKFHLKYIQKFKDDGPALVGGKGIHAGQEADNLAKLAGRDMGMREVLEVAAETVKHEGALRGITVNLDTFVRDHTAQLEKWYTLGWRDKVRPVPGTVEGAFRIELGFKDPLTGEPDPPALFQGFVDVVSQEGAVRTVIDYKSGGRPVRQKLAEDNLQFVGYAMAGKAPFVQVISFVRGERQKPTVQRTTPILTTEERVRKFLRFVEYGIRGVRTALKGGSFPRCSPSAYYCGQGGCAFFALCYPGKIENRFVSVEKIIPVGECAEPEWHRKIKEIEMPPTRVDMEVPIEDTVPFVLRLTRSQIGKLEKFFTSEDVGTERMVAVPFWAEEAMDAALEDLPFAQEKEPK